MTEPVTLAIAGSGKGQPRRTLTPRGKLQPVNLLLWTEEQATQSAAEQNPHKNRDTENGWQKSKNGRKFTNVRWETYTYSLSK